VNGQAVDVTTQVSGSYVCGNVSSFSPFVVATLIPLPTQVANLRTLIAGMRLDKGLANDLDNRLADVARKLGSPKDACNGLADFVQTVIDDAGAQQARLTVAQAEAIVAAANTVEGFLGCGTGAAPRPQAEEDLLALIGIVNGMGLDNGLASDLRSKARDAEKDLAHDTVANACHTLGELGREIAERAGKNNGPTAPQAATLSAAVAQVAAELGC
jgi:hypothetical protein